jgi:DNA-directed RNA polymerase specialized sigma24 family protein
MTLITLAPCYTYSAPRALTTEERDALRRLLCATPKAQRDAVILEALRRLTP